MGQSGETIIVVGRILHFNMHIAIFQPTEPFEFFKECGKPLLPQWISLHAMQQDADASHLVGLLRAQSDRPSRRASEPGNE
jgi:hypothetical protein